jgi:hypothetical protein
MFAADVFTWVAGAVLFFAIGFFGMVVVVVAGIIGAIRRILGWTDEAPHAGGQQSRGEGTACPHPRCGNRNAPDALYCGRCGRPLRRAYELDAYG